MDGIICAWSIWALVSTIGHNPSDHNPFTLRVSLVFDIAGTYLYARMYIDTPEAFIRAVKCLAVFLIPFAVAMLVEKLLGRNLSWALATGTLAESASRGGRVRAGGPFMHAILAGTAGASSLVLFPLLIRAKRFAILGIVAALVIIYCSSSSGPIGTLLGGLFALLLWPLRRIVGLVCTFAVLGVLALHMLMNDPVWYLLARIDLTGGSTGYHRARLISAAIEHIDDWWLWGTDYTRDWIPYGIEWSQSHVDITNHYIKMGVIGGLPLMLLFISIFIVAFSSLTRGMQVMRHTGDPNEYTLWCTAAALFAHCVTFVSVSYFDQSFVFFCVLLGAVPGLCRFSLFPRMRHSATYV